MKGNGNKIRCLDLVLTIIVMEQSIREIGRIISRVDKEFMSFPMEQFMKVSGSII